MAESPVGNAPRVALSTRFLTVAAGILTALAGVVVAVWPSVTVTVFSRLGGWVMGLSGLVLGVALARRGRLKSWTFAGALAGGAVGITLAVWPGQTLLVATVLAGAWLIIDGMSRVMDTMSESSVKAEVLGNLLGLVEAVFGVLVIARPIAGVRAAALLAGAGLVVAGVSRIRDGLTDLEVAG